MKHKCLVTRFSMIYSGASSLLINDGRVLRSPISGSIAFNDALILFYFFLSTICRPYFFSLSMKIRTNKKHYLYFILGNWTH